MNRRALPIWNTDSMHDPSEGRRLAPGRHPHNTRGRKLQLIPGPLFWRMMKIGYNSRRWCSYARPTVRACDSALSAFGRTRGWSGFGACRVSYGRSLKISPIALSSAPTWSARPAFFEPPNGSQIDSIALYRLTKKRVSTSAPYCICRGPFEESRRLAEERDRRVVAASKTPHSRSFPK